jgi:hypothetical protein
MFPIREGSIVTDQEKLLFNIFEELRRTNALLIDIRAMVTPEPEFKPAEVVMPRVATLAELVPPKEEKPAQKPKTPPATKTPPKKPATKKK